MVRMSLLAVVFAAGVLAAPAQAHRLRVEPVQAVTRDAIQATYAAGDPWPGVHLDGAWLGKCVRHGSHHVACRMWAFYSRTDEAGARRIQLCSAWVRADADPASDVVTWDVPEYMDCREVAGYQSSEAKVTPT